ncbi:MAG TPA: hypothetical protein VMY78_15795 [Solirubrobacteraceae bacterium]|nr:hypothetical protein [Solirubrobacteraceae bacterium]
MPRRLLVVLIGGLLLLPAGSALAAPANVTLRAEGVADTLVARTALHTDTRTVNKSGVAGEDCTGTSVAGALEIATAGNWGGTFFAGLGYSVERILGETHAFPEPDFFELWVNNRSSPLGICQVELQEGDDVLFIVARCVFDPVTFTCANPPVLPLGLTVPSVVAPGAPFDVSVVQFATDGTTSPVAGATIDDASGQAIATTNAAGVAAVTLGAGGPATLRASKPGNARSARQGICATTGADGLCGTAVPGAAPIAPEAVCETSGSDGRCGTRDRTSPAIGIVGIRDGRRFARGKGPRALRAKALPDPSGLLQVKFRLTRTDGPRCSYFSGRLERFRTNRNRCGAASGFWFGVGDREDTSYLLPRPLPRGRYVLDVNVIDKAFNRDDGRRRGGNRIVFHVG